MIYIKPYKLFESSDLSKSELINILIELSSDFYSYVQDYNNKTKSGHNLHFKYDTALDTINILSLIGIKNKSGVFNQGDPLTIDSPDGLIRAICNELIKIKVKFKKSLSNSDIEKREPEYTNNGERLFTQKRLYLKYYDFGDIIENLIKDSRWDIPKQSEMNKSDLDFIEDSIISETDDMDLGKIDLSKLDIDAVPGENGCYVRIPISSNKLDYDMDLIKRLDSYFGGLIILKYDFLGSNFNHCKLYLPFYTVSNDLWNFYSKS